MGTQEHAEAHGRKSYLDYMANGYSTLDTTPATNDNPHYTKYTLFRDLFIKKENTAKIAGKIC